jgi:dipeptidyl aminopeptidase/acylaminoacyl peptidase
MLPLILKLKLLTLSIYKRGRPKSLRGLALTAAMLALFLVVAPGCSAIPTLTPPEPANSPLPTQPPLMTPPTSVPTQRPQKSATAPVLEMTTPSEPGEQSPETPTVEPERTEPPALPTEFSPESTSQLLFITEGRLAQWNPVSDEMSLLATRVVEYSASMNGEAIAVLRSRVVEGSDLQGFSLMLVDIAGNKKLTLLEQSDHLYNLSISPDGRWIAYTTQAAGGSIFVMRTQVDSQSQKLGACENELELTCQGIITWSRDSAQIAWSDASGIWVSDLEPDSAHIVMPNRVDVKDPKGETSEISISFSQLEWSPVGRYIMAHVSPTASEVQWQAIVDTELEKLAEVPGTYQLDQEPASVGWLSDGNLFIAYPSNMAEGQPLIMERWQVLPTREDLLGLVNTYRLTPEDFPDLLPFNEKNLDTSIRWPFALNDRIIAFEAIRHSPAISPTLFTFDLKYGILGKVNVTPTDTIQVLWAPDLVGALVLDEQGEVFFAPANGDTLVKLLPLLGDDAHGFAWLAPLRPGRSS